MPSSVINSDDGVISGTSGIKAVGGDDGVLVFQSKGTETAQINTDSQIVAAAGTASLPVLTTTGDVNTGIYFPAADNIGFATGGTIRGRWTTAGLCFGSDTAAANALDDYEEGTWTPTLFGASTAGTTTYTEQTGLYTKIGRQVTVSASVSASATTGTGELRIGGLPFTVGSGTSFQTTPYASSLNWGGGTYLSLITRSGETNIEMQFMADDASAGNQNLTNESQNIRFTLTYFVA